MFSGCTYITELNLAGFDTSNVSTMDSMFADCTNLATIYARSSYGGASAYFDLSSVTSSTGMFTSCSAITGDLGTTYDSSYTDKTYAHLDGGSGDEGYFSSSLATYTVTYDGNSSTSGSVSASYANERNSYSITVADQGTLDRTGYSFMGWDSSSSASAPEYTPGTNDDTISSISSNMTLYAIWDAPHVFDGSSTYEKYSVDLFDSTNYTKDFLISFTIDGSNVSQTAQAVILQDMYESSPYPGLVLRFNGDKLNLTVNIVKDGVNVGNASINLCSKSETDGKTIALKRESNKLYYSLDGGSTYTDTGISDTSNFTPTSTNLIFGARLYTDGTTTDRYIVCTLTDLKIILDGDPIYLSN